MYVAFKAKQNMVAKYYTILKGVIVEIRYDSGAPGLYPNFIHDIKPSSQ